MSRSVRLGEVLLGTEGAALFRHVLEADDEFVERRIENIKRFAASLAEGSSAAAAVPELDVETGYAAWAPVYDTMANALIDAEEPLVDQALVGVTVGEALDAACGTGRHAARLRAAGWTVTGIDRTEAMLDLARAKVPDASFERGDLHSLAVGDATFDLAVCALALTHLEDPTAAITEIARAVRPGGRVVLTDAHPMFVLIQGQALFPTPGGLAFVRNFAHLHSTYIRAFAAAGLRVPRENKAVGGCGGVRNAPPQPPTALGVATRRRLRRGGGR